MERLSLYWAKRHADLYEMAIDKHLIQEGVVVETDELVNLLENYDHRYDDYTIEKLKRIAKFYGLEEDLNDKSELIAFMKEADDPAILEEIKLWDKARLNKRLFDETKEYRKKPKFIKEGCVKKRVNYSADDYVSWKQCENKVQGKKCKIWDEVSVEVMTSKEKYICNDCMKNKSPAKKAKK